MPEEIKNDINTEEKELTLAEQLAQEAQTEEVAEKEEPKEEKEVEKEVVEEKKEPTEEEIKKLKAQEEYKKRQEERKKKLAEQIQPAEQKVTNEEQKVTEAVEFIKKIYEQHKFETLVADGSRELEYLEKDFKTAYTDYDDKVGNAMKFAKYRLVANGTSEAEAERILQREKVLIADQAVQRGQDPVEAIYNEANEILSVFERFAKDMGYSKGDRKTNLQALREISKPNPMSGNTGKGGLASRKDFEDLEGDEIDNITLGQMLRKK